MADSEYGAVVRPEWSAEIARSEHPADGSPLFIVDPKTASSLRGDGWSPTPLILLHGVGNSGAVFGPLLSAMSAFGPVAAPTMSPELMEREGAAVEAAEGDGDHDRSEAVDALVEWLAQVHPPPWRLVGHSMGGVLAGLILRSRSDLVASAVLLNSPLPGTVRRLRTRDSLDRNGRAVLALKGLSRITSFGRPRLPRFLRGPELALVRTALRGFVADPGELDDQVISRAILQSRTTDGIDFLRLAREMPSWEPEAFSASPVAIVLGDDDPLVPMADIDGVTSSYPHADLHVVEHCGHFVHLEQPRFTLDAMSNFYAGVHA